MCEPISAAAAITAATTLYSGRKQRKAQEASERDAEAARMEAERLFSEQETARDAEAEAKRKAEEDKRRADEARRATPLILGGPRQPAQRGFGLRLFSNDASAPPTGVSGVRPPTLGI
jgi:hypothetical protein